MEAATILGFDEPGMFQTTGTVSASSDGRFEVASAEGTLRAGRAVSCLVEPEEGDLVLVAGPRSGDLFVLAVLERPGEGEARITSDRDVSIELGSWRLRLVAARGIELLTSSVLTAAAATIEARATDGSAVFKGARLVAATVDTVVELPKTVPDGVAFDIAGNLYVSMYRPDVIYRRTPSGRLDVLAEDFEGTLMAAPTNIAFCGGDRDVLLSANIGRWHITRYEVGAAGLPLHYPDLG